MMKKFSKKYLVLLNYYRPNLYFTHQESRKQLSELEIIVNVEGKKFARDLFWKTKDCHQ